MKLNGLKPCPFCGGIAELKEQRFGTAYGNPLHTDCSATIVCRCGLSFEKEWTIVEASDGIVKLNEDIIDAWNRRIDNANV
jgi:hypothetical protein